MAISASVEDMYTALVPGVKVVFPSFDVTGVMRSAFIEADFLAKRIKIVKDSTVFWAILITSQNTNNFSKVNIFLHPSPNQHTNVKGTPNAPDSAYEAYTGGWPEIESNYSQTLGVQHAASAASFPLLIAMMRMSAFTASSPANDMFASQPVETLNEIMRAGTDNKKVSIGGEISTSSFSNGIVYQATTMSYLVNRVIYCVDYDSSYIKGKTRDIGPSTGRTIQRYSQKKTAAPATKNFFVPDPRWPADMKNKGQPFTERQVHHMICWHCHTDAMNSGPLM